ncbi:class I SAM-dependent methyltransferase [Methanophagales archaeon]|nr:MAG: class I SAM-dependent methyltransferase [Methanophagales archaeon]
MIMSWNNVYKEAGNIWGERPGGLAIAMVKYLRGHKTNDNMIRILDIGCGYGRDALYFLGHFRCEILGIDISEKTIDMAKKAALSRKMDYYFSAHFL